MLDGASNHELLEAWRAGNERAATILVERYLTRLTALARARLSRRLARRLDPEDVAMSAWRSFFLAARERRISAPADDDLWPLLVTITLRKLRRQSARQRAGRRSIDCEQSVAQDEWVSYAASHEPSPDDAAQVADEVEAALAILEGTAREVFVRRLRGEDAAHIAAELNCSERTVRRALERIRQVLASRGESPGGEPARTACCDSEQSPAAGVSAAQAISGGTQPGPLESPIPIPT